VRAGLLVLALVAAPLTTAAARAQEVTYSGSLQYASGSYIFTRTIQTFTLQNGLAVRLGHFRLDGSVPVIMQNSGAVSLVGGVPIPTGGSSHGAVAGRGKGERIPSGSGSGRGGSNALLASAFDPFWPTAATASDSIIEETTAYQVSLGDPLVSGALDVFQGSGVFRSLSVRASAKVPLNDLDSGVGTGEWDYGVSASGVVGLGPAIGLVDVSYWWYGDLPLLELRDGPSWGAGLALPISRSVWASGLVSGTTRIVETAEAPLSFSLGLSYSRPGFGSLSLLAGAGLSETAPDFTASVGWRRSLAGSR
jgi:hypothetical protein